MGPEKGRVICIEDYEGVTDLVKELFDELKIPGVGFVSISTREDAEKLLKDSESTGEIPSAVVLNMHLHDESGLPILDQIRGSKTPLKGVPVLVISGDETLREPSMEHGANLFFQKPFRQTDEFKNALAVCLNQSDKPKAV